MLSQDSFDKSVELLAVNTADQLVYIHEALIDRRNDAHRELESDLEDVVKTMRRLKRQMAVLEEKRRVLDEDDLGYLTFRLNELAPDDNISVSKTVLVGKIREARKKVEDVDTKIEWMGNRIRKLARKPSVMWRYIGDLNEEVFQARNALKMRWYLDDNGIRFGDLRSQDFDRMYYKLRENGEL